MNLSNSNREKPRVLIMTAVAAEQEAVLRGIKNNSKIDVVAAGVGPVQAGVSTTKALSKANYNLVISVGIGGGFSGHAEMGDVVVATSIIAADLGVQTGDGFVFIEQLGFGSSQVSIDESLAKKISTALKIAELSIKRGPILTVSTVTGTQATTLEMISRVPGATAEAMEGFGVATAAADAGVPVLEIRTISNLVGPRDRSAWQLKEALETLENVSSVLAEVL
ncbi:futalosine hydrolase [Bacillaceae bacterium IKA-2]|nr:futalosine hydrolase [Bacillaceae bacterium IKA-2]